MCDKNQFVNPKGIASFSPGLARFREGLPWVAAFTFHNPERVEYQRLMKQIQPLQGCDFSLGSPRVARSSQPWAECFNPVGIETPMSPLQTSPGIPPKTSRNHFVLPAYLELLSIHSIGPKIAAFLCRDLVWIFDGEKEVLSSEQLMLQPVDTWIRQVAELLWPRLKHLESGKADFLIATQIVSVSHQLDQSGVAFNQGSWHFGSRELRPGETLDSGLQRLAKEPN